MWQRLGTLRFRKGGGGCWNPSFCRPFNNWEVDLVEQFLLTIQGKRVSANLEDRVSVKSLYGALQPGNAVLFPRRIIWSPFVPPKVSFFA